MAKIPDSLCVAPWVSLYMHPGGLIAPCCSNINRVGTTSGNLAKDINCQGLSQVRKTFLKGEIPKGCEVCYSDEANGQTSQRQRMQEMFPHEENYILTTDDEGFIPQPHIKYLDIRWSNLCNFKCRFCSYGLSSSWAPDYVKRFGLLERSIDHMGTTEKVSLSDAVLHTKVDFKDFEENILPNLEMIQFLGGEPLIMDEFYLILEKLIETNHTHIKVDVVSNISSLNHKGRNCLELLKHFSKVTFSASLDGMDGRAEYMRKGTVWPTVEANLRKLQDFFREQRKEKRHMRLQVFHTIYALNAFHTVDFYRHLKSFFEFEIKSNFCHNPEYMRLDVLPPTTKRRLLNHYQQYPEFYQPLLVHLQEDLKENKYHEQYFQTFLEEIKVFDEIRREDFFKTFPEFSDLYRAPAVESVYL